MDWSSRGLGTLAFSCGPEVSGMSTQAVLPAHVRDIPHGDYHPRTDHLNVAQSMASVTEDRAVFVF